jgi:hypothetical protein
MRRAAGLAAGARGYPHPLPHRDLLWKPGLEVLIWSLEGEALG